MDMKGLRAKTFKKGGSLSMPPFPPLALALPKALLTPEVVINLVPSLRMAQGISVNPNFIDPSFKALCISYPFVIAAKSIDSIAIEK